MPFELTESEHELSRLRHYLFDSEPYTRAIRPKTIEYLKLLARKADGLSLAQLCSGGEGLDIAGDICGILAYESATEGVEHDGWLNRVDEPELDLVLNLSASLDLDANQPAIWRQLLSVIEKL